MDISEINKLFTMTADELETFRQEQALSDDKRDTGWAERVLLEVIQGIYTNPSDSTEQKKHRDALIPEVIEAKSKGHMLEINGGGLD